MTDEQIVKALECCKIGNCDDCPFYGVKEDCEVELPEEALDLINRKKAENERLEDENYTLKNKIEIRDNLIEQLGSDIDIKYNTIYTMREKLKNSKSEAIKEFAERLKNKIWYSDLCNLERTITPEIITNLVKEMTEVQK